MIDQDRPGSDATDLVGTNDDAASPLTDSPSPVADPTGATDAPGTPDAVPAAPELPPKFMPPEGGDPFSFRVDRTDVPVPGARVIDGHLVMPREAWDQHIQSKWVANRSEWTRREEQYKHDIRTLRDQTIPEEKQKAQTQLALLGDMLDGTPQGREKLIAWLDNYEQNAPMLRQQAETRILQEKLAKYEREQSDATVARQAEELKPRLVSYLNDQVATAQKEFPALASQKDLADRTFKYFAPRLYYEDADGQVQFNHELFRDIMQDEAKRALGAVQQTAKVAEVAKKNAAAVGPPRTPTGQFVKPGVPAPTGRLTAEEWQERFEKKQYT